MAFCIRRNANGAMQMAQRNAMTKRNPAKRVQNKRALLAYYFIDLFCDVTDVTHEYLVEAKELGGNGCLEAVVGAVYAAVN